jgi:hypothetical protein
VINAGKLNPGDLSNCRKAKQRAVIKIDNHIIGNGKVGPLTKRLSELYAKRTANEGIQVVDD